uniref:CRAL-TRIO domain-containing protein n=1 Tax=Picea sitchensis TaxID=3332 RepID=A9NQT2_PICSI|nr:unknown [Picea sitchensis]
MDRLSSGQTTCYSVEKLIDGGSNFDNSISDAVRTKLRLMRDIIEKEDPSSKIIDDATLQRFLYARELNVEKASEMFAKYRKWRQSFVPLGYIPETMICDELMKNSAYMQGFDKRGRPIAVILLGRHIPCRKTIENLKRHYVYIFDKMSASSSRGQTKFTIIADFDGWTYKNVDIRGAIAVLEILQIVFVEDKHFKETLLNDIDESQLPEIYGGKLPIVKVQDCVVPNWPPVTST